MKPTKNTIYKIGDIEIQHYTNGSFGYLLKGFGWRNIPKQLGETLIKLKVK